MALRKVQPARALVLFDIDGTLLRRIGPHHRQVLVDSVRHVTGLETTTDHIPLQGMLDPDILAVMMRDAGASAALIGRALPAVIARAQSLYVRRCPDLRSKVCPGMRPVLARLARSRIPAGLVTGNLTHIGWKKLRRAGLEHYFRFGVFAEQARDRAGLVCLALRQARSQGWIDGAAAVSLVGDHANDILAARANGIRSVAVATGVSPAEELASYSPDVLLPDLRALKLEMLYGSSKPLG